MVVLGRPGYLGDKSGPALINALIHPPFKALSRISSLCKRYNVGY